MARLEDALDNAEEKITDLELSHKDTLESLAQLQKEKFELELRNQQCINEFQKLMKLWDENRAIQSIQSNYVKIEDCERGLNKANQDCKDKIMKAGELCESTVSKLVNQTNSVKASLVEINKELGDAAVELGNSYNECSQELHELKLECKKTDHFFLKGPASKFRIAVEKTVAMFVCFLIWPIYLRDPEGYLWKLIKEYTGLSLKRGPFGISRKWAVEATSMIVLVLWMGLLGGLFYRQLILLPELNSSPKNSMHDQEQEQEQPVSSRKQKIEKFFRNLWGWTDVFGLDEKIDEITKMPSGGAFQTLKPEEICYGDFLIFTSIHSHKCYNYLNRLEIEKLFKSIKTNIKVKRKVIQIDVILDKIINYSAPMVFFLMVYFSSCAPYLTNTNNLLETMNLKEPVVIYRQNLTQELESQARHISETELKLETVLENNVEKTPTKIAKTVQRKRKRSQRKRRKAKLVKYSDFIKNFETQNDEYDEYIEIKDSCQRNRELPIKIKNNNMR